MSKLIFTKISESQIVYFDHQIWCGMANNEPRYADLKSLVGKFRLSDLILMPYSMAHIQELVELDKNKKMSKEERFEKAQPILNFIKQVSQSFILNPNNDYSSFKLEFRDPIEAFTTFTEIELRYSRVDILVNILPKEIIQVLRTNFKTHPIKLNNLNEQEAINEINKGIKAFIDDSRSDPILQKNIVASSIKSSREIIERLHHQVISTIDDAIYIIREEMEVHKIDSHVQAFGRSKIQILETNKTTLERELLTKIKDAEKASRTSYANSLEAPTFEQILELTQQLDHGNALPRDFHKAFLLDLFGYKSKLKNRSSDYFDIIHRQYIKISNYFVTDDISLQKKIGVLGDLIPHTRCRLLGSPELISFLHSLDT